MRTSWMLIAMLAAQGAAASYKCVDEKGVTRIGDTPPAECGNVVMYEMKGTAVVRRIDPSLTPEQIRAKAEEAERLKGEKRIEADKKRQDMALLNTYSSEKEFDVARDRNIEPIKGRIASAQERFKGVEARERKLEEEMEFYKAGKSKAKAGKGGDEPPPGLTADLARARAEKAALVNATAGYEKEIEQVKARYEADKKRWLELKNAVNKPKEDPKGPATVTLSAGAAGIAKCGDKIYECPAGNEYICREGRKEYKVHCVVPSGTSSPAPAGSTPATSLPKK